MDTLLARLGAQAMNMAIRSGITITSAYAIQQYGRLVAVVDDKKTVAELKSLQQQLNAKIKIITPTIDLIEFKSGRGNVFLQSAVDLTKDLHREIVGLGRRLEDAASESEDASFRSRSPEIRQAQLKAITADIKNLLARIDRDIPLLQLAITASGESMSTTLPAGVSPSRLLQASTFLIVGDTQFATFPGMPVQIGPSFTLSLYMLFAGHSEPGQDANPSASLAKSSAENCDTAEDSTRDTRPYGFGEGERKPIWQEVLHKARVRLCRTPPGFVFDSAKGYHAPSESSRASKHAGSALWELQEYNYQDKFSYFLEVIEDLDDGRAHGDDDGPVPNPFQDVDRAGIREAIPIHQVAKIFYADTGKILNIGSESDSESNPVLLLKRDTNVEPPKPRNDVAAVCVEPGIQGCIMGQSDGEESDEQDDIDRQIRKESEIPDDFPTRGADSQPSQHPHAWNLPPHLDPEWLALEVYADDGDTSETSSETVDDRDDDDDEYADAGPPGSPASPSRPRSALPQRPRSSLDSRLIEQIRNISLRTPPRNGTAAPSRPPSSRSATMGSSAMLNSDTNHRHHPSPSGSGSGTTSAWGASPSPADPESAGAFVSRSPFGAITSSLSLLEMLIRLTSLQEFQQTSHLAIPDHVLTFFLEETSTTGLRGADRWKARSEARRKVGFDPYTDTPAR